MGFPADPVNFEIAIVFNGSTLTYCEAYVRTSEGVSRTFARPGPSATRSDPGRVTFTLQTAGAGGQPDLPSGTWNPRDPSGAYWQRNGWLGVIVAINVEDEPWFYGRISRVECRWDTDGYGYADIEASSALRWLQWKSKVRSPLEREITAAAPVLYLPMTDGPIASRIATPIAGLTPIDVSGIKFAQISGPVGDTRSLPEFVRDGVGGSTAWEIPLETPTGTSWTVEFMVRAERLTDAYTAYAPITWYTGADDTAAVWTIDLGWNGGSSDPDVLRLLAVEIVGAGYVVIDIDTKLVLDGEWHHVQVRVEPSGGSTRADMTLDGGATASDSDTTISAGGVTGLELLSVSTSTLKSGSTGHVVVHNTYTPGETYLASQGYTEDNVYTRLYRAITQDETTIDIVTGYDETTVLGPQPTGRLLDVLQDAEDADFGRLVERVDAHTLRYATKAARYGAAQILTIGPEHQTTSPVPAQKVGELVGSIEASRVNGSSVTVTDDARLANGGVESQVDVNVFSDEVLTSVAQWAMGLQPTGTSGVSTIAVDLATDGGSLVASWLAAIATQPIRADIQGVAGMPEGLDVFVEGWTETISDVDWTVELVVSPARPYDAFTRGSDTLGRSEAELSTLSGAVTTTGTTLVVATSDGPLWTTEPAHLPVEADVEGERVTVTDIVCRVHDRFARTETNGWGTADAGGSWTCSGGSASDFYTIIT
jgi:hypothetical protein